jgi:chemotaxis protein MotB
MAKIKALPTPAPQGLRDDEDDEQDCPRCPPVGAPAWMATFADMATLLMAFFVLILSFANFDEVSFKKMTGALREHFGSTVIEIMQNPDSTTVLEMNYRPASAPPSPQDSPDPDQEPAPGKSSESDGADMTDGMDSLSKALAEALEQAGATVQMEDGKVTLKLPDETGDLAQALSDAAPDIMTQGEATDQSSEMPGQGATTGEQSNPGDAGASDAQRAAIAEARLKVALREIEAQGLVDVEQQQDKVIVTIGAGGAFQSASAELSDDAREVMARIALASAGDRGQITVTGHTDSVPLGGGPFVDNWGLAAARAASVVRELGGQGLIDPARLTAVSRGESNPVADNATEDGRSANRRIEIVIDFGSAP